MSRLSPEAREVILMMAEEDMNISAVARKLRKSRAAIDWRIDLILKETGMDIRVFYDLVELVDRIKEGEI